MDHDHDNQCMSSRKGRKRNRQEVSESVIFSSGGMLT
jgi:hypothetical protein